MLPREMHPALWAGEMRQERQHLAGPEIGERTACPRVVVPTLRHPTLEVLTDAGEDPLQLREGEEDSVALRHPGHTPAFNPTRLRLEDSARPPTARRARCGRPATGSESAPPAVSRRLWEEGRFRRGS